MGGGGAQPTALSVRGYKRNPDSASGSVVFVDLRQKANRHGRHVFLNDFLRCQ